MRWLKEGDANSKIFHRCVQKNRKYKEILGLNFEGNFVEGVEPLRREVKNHFKNHFSANGEARIWLGSLQCASLDRVVSNNLTGLFSEEEVRDAIWDCGSYKSLGPDGVTFSFIKNFWEDVKSDFLGFLEEFHVNGKLVRGSNCSFIVLIPKRENPVKVGDFRPISLIGCLYKVLAKVLANRLRKVIHLLIPESQSAFVKGRQILDGILIANELVDDAKKKRKGAVLFKVDFEKAYDSVSWCFLDLMMAKMGFNGKWRRWIWECLSSGTTSVLVNGSPMEEFSVGLGLRQGVPLSPFLFLIVVEGLNMMFMKAYELGLYEGYKVGGYSCHIYSLQMTHWYLEENVRKIFGV